MDERRGSSRQAAVAVPRRWKFTVDEFQRMAEAGILHDDDRVELLEGELFAMPPNGDWHNGSVNASNWRLGTRLGNRAVVQVQGALRLSPHSAPQPDILVLRFREDFYRSALPRPEDVLLLAEVSDSSLDFDRDTRLPLYARAGIAEGWIATRQPVRVEVHREPEGDRYRSVRVVERGGEVAPLAFPDLALRVADILG